MRKSKIGIIGPKIRVGMVSDREEMLKKSAWGGGGRGRVRWSRGDADNENGEGETSADSGRGRRSKGKIRRSKGPRGASDDSVGLRSSKVTRSRDSLLGNGRGWRARGEGVMGEGRRGGRAQGQAACVALCQVNIDQVPPSHAPYSLKPHPASLPFRSLQQLLSLLRRVPLMALPETSS